MFKINISQQTYGKGLTILAVLFVVNTIPTFKIENFDTPKTYVRRFFTALGLAQHWNMFAPNPIQENGRVFGVVKMKNGELRDWKAPYISAESAYEKYNKEHWHKWATDHARMDRNKNLWPKMAEYIAKNSLKENESVADVDHVELWREWYRISMPVTTEEPGLPTSVIPKKDFANIKWSQHKFYEKFF